jgi:hypothetical protein
MAAEAGVGKCRVRVQVVDTLKRVASSVLDQWFRENRSRTMTWPEARRETQKV